MVYIDKDNVVILKGHTHKLCGIATKSECNHKDIETHAAHTYDKIITQDIVDNSLFPKKRSAYLTENIDSSAISPIMLNDEIKRVK